MYAFSQQGAVGRKYGFIIFITIALAAGVTVQRNLLVSFYNFAYAEKNHGQKSLLCFPCKRPFQNFVTEFGYNGYFKTLKQWFSQTFGKHRNFLITEKRLCLR